MYKPIKRVQVGKMPTLAELFSDWNEHDPAPEDSKRADFIMIGCHIVTLSMRGKTHYFWGAAFDVPNIPTDFKDKTSKSVTAAFDEDKYLLEKYKVR